MADDKSTALHAKWVWVHDEEGERIERDRWVVVEGEHISGISKDAPAGAERIELPECLVLPGLINAHNHAVSSVMFRGITEDWDAETFETELIYGLLMPLGDLAIETLEAGEMQAVVELALLELLKGGTTTLFEIFRNRQHGTFEAAERMGLRFYGAPYLFSTGALTMDADGEPAYAARGADESDLDRCLAFRARHDNTAGGRIRFALGPHGADSCEPELLREIRKTADELDCLINIHLAQTRSEVALLERKYGMTPAEYLEHTGMVGPDVIAAHCIHCPDDDLKRLRASDTTVVNCPMTFARGGVYAPFGRFHGEGIRTVVGTDGYYMDMLTELRMAGVISKLYAANGSAATAKDLLTAATVTGAAALRRDDIGRITPGARADLIAVSLARPHFQPVSDPFKTFLWNARGGDVDVLMVDGELLISEGRFTRADEDEIVGAGARAVQKVWSAAREAGIKHVPG